MSAVDDSSNADFLSPKEIEKWLLQETRDSAKAHELRMKSAIELATGYILGELTPQQAHERFLQHGDRWGEALPGTHAFQNSTDDQLLAAIDRARSNAYTQIRGELHRRLTNKGEANGPAR